mgnify:FL=1
MTNQTLADLLVLALLFIGNARFVFVNHSEKDSLSIAPFAGLFIAIVNIFVFTLSVENFFVFALAFLSAVWNFRSVLRMFSDVILDQYELKLILICSLNALFAALMIFAVIYFCPMSPKKNQLPVKQKTVLYSGNFQKGFSKLKEPFTVPSAKLYNFEPETESPAGRKIILFAPPETANSEIYKSFFCKLAYNGFSVYSLDFYSEINLASKKGADLKWIKRFLAIRQKIFDSDKYEQTQKSSDVISEKFWILLSLCKPTEKDTIFLVTDEDLSGSMQYISQKSFMKIFGSFDLAYIDDYTTKGFGPVENTEPVLGAVLGVQPDRSGYMSNHLGTVLTDFINTQMISGY